ncbi:alpha/beta hydrolase [Haloarcula sp. Atlit-7R]|uniref:alpha/beta hydrolase n=1 Tax=Haloarcula sp. Atlit-7R TaxID=2282125 RepID=UPI000EF152A1|nr:alpha/beta fold hydrolase [Haloarcula sp. Atlit-7R]RLM89460.1 alpha/beta fold hydrolase [Haloarcula sp. Atlit-7R]
MKRDVTFESAGAELSGWFYSPDSSPPWPVVVMAHGFSATKQMVADRYAEVFTETGVAVLLYDHRGFGESGGEPRQQVNPWVQARGYRDAIAFATTLKNVDPARIAVWGDSYSSGAALVVAALDTRVAALVIQVPALGDEVPSDDPDGSARESMKQMVRTGSVEPVADEIRGPMPVVWDDQDRRPSALKPETAFRWFNGYGTRPDTNWTNEVTIVRPKSPQWQPGLCATDVTCPALFVVSPEDEMPRSAPTVARDAYERLSGPKEWVEIPGGHFGLLYYPSETFDRASSAQSRFLVETILAESD